MDNEQKRPVRRSRRKKQEVEVVTDAPTLDATELKAEGFEKKRARDPKGHFIKDDPSTPENEAFEWVKPVEEKPEPVVQETVKPWKRPVRPIKAKTNPTNQRGQRRR
tara:strand:- start:27 stop:347 length:321 start_codon:yes stop_codon:yes gene_type:complete